MSRLKIVYVLSLAIFASLVVFTVFRPMARAGRYSAVTSESLIETNDAWILQFDVINREGKDTQYSVKVAAAGEPYGDKFLIQDGSVYTYIHHFRRDTVGAGDVSYTVNKEGEVAPVEQATYHLK